MFREAHSTPYIEQVYVFCNKKKEQTIEMFFNPDNLPKDASAVDELEISFIDTSANSKPSTSATVRNENIGAYVLEQYKDLIMPKKNSKSQL
jgi:hypothetical protein